MIKVIYNSMDISSKVDISNASFIDNAGGIADTLTITFADTLNLWSNWQPQKGDTIEISKDGLSSGLMYIDEISQGGGYVTLSAISTPLSIKTPKSRAWENVRLLDVAKVTGLSIKPFNIINYLYERIDQDHETDLEFLNRLCIREGYSLKVANNNVVIFDEASQEAQDSIKTIYKTDMKDPCFETTNAGLFSNCLVRYFGTELLQYTFSPIIPPIGGTLKITEPVYNIAEAERYAIGYLRNANKYEQTGLAFLQYQSGITAGNSININGMGVFDSKYYVFKAIHDLFNNATMLYLRKPLVGY